MTAISEGKQSATGTAHGMGGRILAEGEYSLDASAERPALTDDAWRVVVQVGQHLVSRLVWYGNASWPAEDQSTDLCGQGSGELIWPTWPATLAEEEATSASPLKDLQRHWDSTVNRLRESAKWMAAVLGAAMASIIPTAPLTGLGQRHISAASAALGTAGLLFVTITMVLVLQVMRPQAVSYADIQEAQIPVGLRGNLRSLGRRCRPRSHAFESPLYRWRHTILAHPDLYLPCGVASLIELQQLMIIEELTLVALARVSARSADDTVRDKLGHAQQARAARLHELRAAAADIVAVGVYYKARARSTWATYGGAAFGLLGILAVIAAVAWPIN